MGLQRLKKIFSEFPKEVENQCFKSLKIRSKIDDIDECIYNPLTRKNENKEILL